MPCKINFQTGLLPFLGTVLIVGDSIVPGLRESKMSFGRNMKARSFPGAKIQDMYY